MEREMTMNHYGAMAQRHWQTWLPDTYKEMSDPETFFTNLGEEVARQIEERWLVLVQDDPPGEDYTANLARLNTARQQAENDVLRELVLIPPENDDEEDMEEPETPPEEEWIPVVEDQTHPFWRQLRQETESEQEG